MMFNWYVYYLKNKEFLIDIIDFSINKDAIAKRYNEA